MQTAHLETFAARRQQRETADLAKLLAITEEAAADKTLPALISKFSLTAKMLLLERKRGAEGWFAYDVNRHLNLAVMADRLSVEIMPRIAEMNPQQVEAVTEIWDGLIIY